MKKGVGIRKRMLALLCAATMILTLVPFHVAEATARVGTSALEENTGALNRVPWNNDSIATDISAGFEATTYILDVDEDGHMDIVSVGHGIDSLGTVIYYGSANAQNSASQDYMLLSEGYKVRENDTGLGYGPVIYYDDDGVHTAMTQGGTIYTNLAQYFNNGCSFTGTTGVTQTFAGLYNPDVIDGENVTDGRTVSNTSQANSKLNKNEYYWNYDVDGDGILDVVWILDEFKTGEYGAIKVDKFDDNGVWGDNNGDGIGDDDGDGDDNPRHCWILWAKGTGETNPDGKLTYTAEADGSGYVLRTEDGKAIDSYGFSTPQIYDWDGDGDLDIICASGIDEITYYQNIGTRTEPVYAAGCFLPLDQNGDGTVDGTLKAELCRVRAITVDWNGDGALDLVCTEEDGRCFLVQNTGTKDDNGTPVMVNKGYFKTRNASLQAGCLPTPVSVDWDGDGDEDIICGNSAGFLNYIQNLTVEQGGDLTNPIWGPVVRLQTPDGEVYRIQAGYNGSTQGPDERAWGYTMVSVADWDGDGILDIMHNNVWGKVLWHKGTVKGSTTIGYAQPVEVEWSGETPKPQWLWWSPEGDELVVQWRTTPLMIDLPLDEDGDGVAAGDGLMDLVMMDHEGYLTFYQRYEDASGALKLKEGQRIFKTFNGDLRLNDNGYANENSGDSGKKTYVLTDWDQDGDLDLIATGNTNTVFFWQNMSTVAGQYTFAKNGEVSDARTLKQHDCAPAVCDWNGDNVPDLIMANEDGFFYYLLNNAVEEEPEEPEEPVVPVEPEDPYAYLQDSLVAHWDFEGEGAEALQDKSKTGSVDDDLTIFDENNTEAATEYITIQDGVATIQDAASLRTATSSSDLRLTTDFTIFMKVQVDSIPSGTNYTTLLSKGRVSNAYAISIAQANANSNWCINDGTYQQAGVGSKQAALPTNTWRELAVVFRAVEGENMQVDYYLSNGASTNSAEDFWTRTRTLSRTGLNGNTGAFIIGNVINAASGTPSCQPTDVTRKFDDIQVFNRALDGDEIASLLPYTPTEDALMAHWDFEGEGDEALRDKSKAGAKADDLTYYTGLNVEAESGSPVSDGVATISGTQYLQAANSDDLQIASGEELTVFMKVRITGTATGNYFLLKKGNSYREYGILASPYVQGWGFFEAVGGEEPTKEATRWAGIQSKPISLPQEEWREIAAVVRYDEGTGNRIIDLYMSKDSATGTAEDFNLVRSIDTGNSTELVSSTGVLRIGNVNGTAAAPGFGTGKTNTDTFAASVTREYDDIQIFNVALTAEQLAGLLPAETEDPVEPVEPVEDTLVAHWDFTGATQEEQLQDKAANGGTATTGGENADTLTIMGDEGNVTIEGGVATITGNGGLQAADSVDLSQRRTMTVFARMRTTDNKGFSIADKGSDSYVLQVHYNSVAKSINNSGYNKSTGSPGFKRNNVLEMNAWREVALVISQKEGYNLSYQVLVSKGDATATGSDFLVFEEGIITDSTRIKDNATALKIGAGSTTATREFSDVRIYSAALTADEIAAILDGTPSSASPYLGDLKNSIGLEFQPSNNEPTKRITISSGSSDQPVDTAAASVSFTPVADYEGQIIEMRKGSDSYAAVTSGVAQVYDLDSGVNTFNVRVSDGVTVGKTYTIKVNCTVPDGDALTAAITEAAAIAQGSYTDSSYTALQSAIAAATAAVSGTTAARAAAYQALVTAEAELTERLRTEDLRALQTQIAGDSLAVDSAVAAKVTAILAAGVPSGKELAAVYSELLNNAVASTSVQPVVTDSIALIYKSTVNASLTASDAPTMTFTVDGETTEPVEGVYNDGNGKWEFTYPEVYAQNMAQAITATLTAGDYSRTYTYSVLDYCTNILKADTLAGCTSDQLIALQDLVADLVKYGAAVQIFRDEIAGAHELLTTKLDARQKLETNYASNDVLWSNKGSAVAEIPAESASVSGYVATMLDGEADENYKWSSMRLVLKDEVNLRCKFKAASLTNLEVRVTVSGGETLSYTSGDFRTVGAGTYELDFGEIYANEYGKAVTFQFFQSGVQVGKTLTYSVNTYLYNKRASTAESENMPQLLLAIYRYGLSANAFTAA